MKEHRTLLSMVGHRHGGTLARLNIDTVELRADSECPYNVLLVLCIACRNTDDVCVSHQLVMFACVYADVETMFCASNTGAR